MCTDICKRILCGRITSQKKDGTFGTFKIVERKETNGSQRPSNEDDEKQFQDYDWIDMFKQRLIGKQKVRVLDKFLKHHKKEVELKMNKKDKVTILEAIIATQIAEQGRPIQQQEAENNTSDESDSEINHSDNTDTDSGGENSDVESDADIVLATFESTNEEETMEEQAQQNKTSTRGRLIRSTKNKDYMYQTNINMIFWIEMTIKRCDSMMIAIYDNCSCLQNQNDYLYNMNPVYLYREYIKAAKIPLIQLYRKWYAMILVLDLWGMPCFFIFNLGGMPCIQK